MTDILKDYVRRQWERDKAQIEREAINNYIASPEFRNALARALPDVMTQEVCDQIYEPGTDPLDCPEEWFMTPYDMADAIIVALRSKK